MAKNKPDDRSDNVERIQKSINFTIKNMELADEMIEKTDDPKARNDLKAKNNRREGALDGFRSEIKDEAKNQKQ
jgi:small acid-soluble spore protein (thioredoxin-like protein)